MTILSEDKTATQAAPGEEPKRRQEGGRDPLWYKDAIIYEVHVRAFFDSDGDGRGDFQGLTAKLDYLQDLGITAIWLLPFYPSPWRDDGYDISDYTSVHPAYGTLEDFQTFLDEAHKRGLQVVTELVINHTSDQHPWFQRARLAPSWSPERDASFLPPAAGERAILLDSYLLKKTVHELGSELANRPDWVRIPLQGIRQILGE